MTQIQSSPLPPSYIYFIRTVLILTRSEELSNAQVSHQIKRLVVTNGSNEFDQSAFIFFRICQTVNGFNCALCVPVMRSVDSFCGCAATIERGLENKSKRKCNQIK